MTQFNPKTQGWDGIYDNQLMPSDDYWFIVKFGTDKNVKGHFTLKR